MQKFPARTRRNLAVAKAKEDGGALKAGVPAWVAGRIVGILDDGFVLQDQSGRVDIVYGGVVNAGDIVEIRLLPEEKIGMENMAFLVFHARELRVLAPCREEFFIRGSDPNWKKMIIDTHRREVTQMRARMVEKIREFFRGKGFIETETPEMVRLPGMEPHLDPFKTVFTGQPSEGGNAAREDMYLVTSPEYAMKKLLVAGHEKIFQIARSFRNRETAGILHNPEFTLLEWYRAYADYTDIMKDTEELVNFLAGRICGGESFIFKDYKIDAKPPWPRRKVKDLFEEYAGIDEKTLLDPALLRDAAKRKGYGIARDALYEDVFFLVFMNEIEQHMGITAPVIVYDYPKQMAALARKSEADPRYAERFEAYIGGVELCNAFTELNDPEEQEIRLRAECEQRKKAGKDCYSIDQNFIGALKFGMPPSGGNALGVDRLAMVLTNTEDINDIMYFPFKDL